LLVAFALVSCAGKGLHLLPGAGHCHLPGTGHCHSNLGHSHAASLGSADCLSHAHAHAHPHGCEHREPAADRAKNPLDNAGSLASDESCSDDCAICAFFAQGQLLTVSHAPEVSGKVHFYSPVEHDAPCLADVPRANSPRAPPLS
jgi:hypothetical protein